MDNNYEAKRVLAEAISRAMYLTGQVSNDDFRNWILACGVLDNYILSE